MEFQSYIIKLAFSIIKDIIREFKGIRLIILILLVPLVITGYMAYDNRNEIINLKMEFEDSSFGRIDANRRDLPIVLENVYHDCHMSNGSIAAFLFENRGNKNNNYKSMIVDSVWGERLKEKEDIKICMHEKNCMKEAIEEMNAIDCIQVIEEIASQPNQCMRVNVNKFRDCKDFTKKLEDLREYHKDMYACVYPSLSKKSYYAVAYFGIDEHTSACDEHRLYRQSQRIFRILRRN